MLLEQLKKARLLPVVTALDVDSTVQLARALQRGGMRAIEITLRTSAGLDAIVAVRQACPELWVAAGTVTVPAELEKLVDLGIDLALSPGGSLDLLDAAARLPLDFVPGVATPSEVMAAQVRGFEVCKLFPATVVGGLGMLKALSGPFPDMQFCPTGGLTPENFRDFLAQPNVVCCGGSWMVAPKLVKEGRWDEIEALAAEAMGA